MAETQSDVYYDEKGQACLRTGYKPTPEEKDVLGRASRSAMVKGLLTSSLYTIGGYLAVGAFVKNASLSARLQRTFALSGPVVFLLSTSNHFARIAPQEIGKLDSPLGEIARVNRLNGRSEVQTSSTQPTSASTRTSQVSTQPTEFDWASDAQRAEASEFERETFTQSAGGYSGGSDAQANPRQPASSSSSSTVTMAELRNRNRSHSSQSGAAKHSQSGQSQPSTPQAFVPQSSSTSSSESFADDSYRPRQDDPVSAKGKKSKYGDSGFY